LLFFGRCEAHLGNTCFSACVLSSHFAHDRIATHAASPFLTPPLFSSPCPRKQVLKPSQGLIIKSPSNGGELIKLWQDKTTLCYRVRYYHRVVMAQVDFDDPAPLSRWGEQVLCSSNALYAPGSRRGDLRFPVPLWWQVLTVKEDDPSAYNQGELKEIALDKVDSVAPSGETAPFQLTIGNSDVSPAASATGQQLCVLARARWASKIPTCGDCYVLVSMSQTDLVIETSSFEELSLLAVGFQGLRDAPLPPVIGGAPSDGIDDGDALAKGEEVVMLPPPVNPGRLACWKVVTNPYFDMLILTSIGMNCFFMAIEDPATGDDDNAPGAIMYMKIKFETAAMIGRLLLWVFTVESLLKNLSFTPWGYFFGPDANWNRLDFFIVVVGWLEEYPDYLGALPFNLSFLRIFRVFRPLRTLGKMDGMKELINTMFLCVDPLVDVLNLTIFVFFVFSVLGMELFQGQGSQRCIDPSNWDEATQTGSWTMLPDDAHALQNLGDRRCGGDFQCPKIGDVQYKCFNTGKNVDEGVFKQNSADGVIGYDNLGQAMLTVFVFCTAEGWTDGMYQYMDSFNWLVSALYHTLMMMLGNMFCFNLALAVIADTFEAEAGNDDEEEEDEKKDGDKEDSKSESGDDDEPKGPRPENAARALLYDVSYNGYFNMFIMLLILLNTITLAMEHAETKCLPLVGMDDVAASNDWTNSYLGEKPECIVQANTMPESMQDFLAITNLVFVIAFAAEAVIKLIGLTPEWYFKDPFNTFDFTIVIVSFIEMSFKLKGMTALRCFRLARLFKAARSWGSLRAIIQSLLNVLPAMTSLSIMLFLFMFIAAVAGMQTLGNAIPYEERARFTDFGVAMLTVFQMLTGENWNEVMFSAIVHTKGYGIVVYFLLVMLIGQFLVLNLFLAIMLSDFDCGEPPDFSIGNMINTCCPFLAKSDGTTDDVDAAMEGEGKDDGDGAFFTPAQLARMADKSSNSDDDVRKNRTRVRSKSNQRKEELEKSGKHGSMEMVTINNDLRKERHNEALKVRNTLKGKALGLLDEENAFRRACMRVCRDPNFESFILFCIIFSSVMLAVNGPTDDDRKYTWVALSYLDFAFIVIFTIECALKIITNGFYWCPEGYLRDPWNVLDFVVVLVAWISSDYTWLNMPWGSAGSGVAAFRTLRSLRALRPLRTIQRLPGMRLVVAVLFECTPVFINICFVVLFFFLVFAIMGVQFFKGQFWACNDGDVTRVDQCWGCFVDEEGSAPSDLCPMPGTSIRRWRNAKMNFDNVWTGLLTLYEVAGQELWLDVMYAAMDTKPDYSINAHGNPDFPYGYQPQQEKNWPASFFFVFFILVGVFIVMNLFVGAVVDKFNELKEANGGKSPLQTDEQAQYTDSMQLMARMRPFKVPLPPRKPLKKATVKALQDKIYCARMQAYKIVMWDTSGKNMGTTFDMIISLCVMLNIVVMGLYYWKRLPEGAAYLAGGERIQEYQATSYYNALELVNNLFTLIFFIEMCLKLSAWGFKQYITDMWNQLDFILVVSSVLGWIVEVLLTSGAFPLNPAVFRILRVARLTRALKSIRMVGRIKGIARLVDTLVLAIPAMTNVASLCFLVIFIFTVMGMDFFGKDDINQDYVGGMYNQYANFRNFGDGFMLLFRTVTGESWNGVMHDIMISKCDQRLNFNDDDAEDYCELWAGSKTLTWAYFLAFHIFVGGLLFELITAIVLDEFGKMNESEKLPVNGDMISNFNDHWAQLDPKATQLIPQFKLLPFLKSIEPPIFENAHEAGTEIFKMNIAASEGPKNVLYVHYVDTLVAVVRYLYVKKLGDEVGQELDVTMIESPELTTRIVNAYPHLKKIEKMEAKDFKTELAATKMQNLWLRKRAGAKIGAVRREMEVELSTRRGTKGGQVDPSVAALPAHELMSELRKSEVGRTGTV